MRKLIFVLLALVTFSVNAQLVVKETPKDTIIWQASKLSPVPKLVKFKLEDVESYTIYYKNAQYTAITDIDYITTGDLETTKQFYELCKQVITEGKEYTLELDGTSISLKKVMASVMIWKNGSFFYLSDKHITSILEKL